MHTVHQKTILVVEDEQAYRHALVLKLEHAGFVAHGVENGEEGLAFLRDTKVDLILLDLIMPKMDGFAFLEALKTQNHVLPVIVLSNLSQADDERKARQLGAKDFLSKSNIPIADVIRRVTNILRA
jgi:DNA-binding response OmpR family regulator